MREMMFHLKMSDLEEPINRYYFQMSGLNKEGKKFEQMRAESYEMKDQIMEGLQIRALVGAFDSFEFAGNQVTLEGVTFECNGFEHIDPSKVRQMYIYILTAGECGLEAEPIMRQLYADMWGTACVDACREYLRETLLVDYKKEYDYNGCEISVSDSFGPGFYGMGLDELENFFKVLNGGKIDVQIKDNRFMLPLKSCAGFFLVAQDEIKMPSKDCGNCIGNTGGCQFCKAFSLRC